MADIELVIKIPEGVMEYIKNNDCLAVGYIDEVAKAIKNGIILPEHHGRLIEDNVIADEFVCGKDDSYYQIISKWIKLQPTIIHATKEGDGE